MPAKKFAVLVDDNYHHVDESERYRLGEFDTLDAAVSACQGIVDEYLAKAHEPGMSAADLYRSYTAFGEDPFIAGGKQAVPFSAWSYARRQCEEICRN